jgi:glycerol-3-phosphate dehydrogenase
MSLSGTTFSLVERREFLSKASEQQVDLLVVGGGITGAGVAREAALRGLTVLVVDKGDFASGTSSRSSKLIHGGVRYLAQGDVSLVREAARERAVLRRIAPHLARPVSMLIPSSSKGVRMKLAAGLWTFDKLAGDANPDRHEVLSRAQTLEAEPGLKSERLAGAVAFTEFITDDARLTLETVKSAALSGAWTANYAEVTEIEEEGERVKVSINDRSSGESAEVRAGVVVNAAGPWFDRVRSMYRPNQPPVTQLTRGIHLVVPRERLPVSHSVVLRSPDGRSTFVVPRDEFTYIGTTDTHYEGAPDEPGVSSDDTEYLLASVAATFDEAPTRADIIGEWSGVRPLLRQEGKKPSEISRRDEIQVGPGPFVAIAGGKLTTYRKMAERVVDKVFEVARRTDSLPGASAERALCGGTEPEQRSARARAESSGDTRLDDRLWQTYGCAAAALIADFSRDGAVREYIGEGPGLTVAEVDYAVRHEMALTVDDVLRRRSHLAMFDSARAVSAAEETARRLAEHFSWDDARTASEVEDFVSARKWELGTVRGEGPQGRE